MGATEVEREAHVTAGTAGPDVGKQINVHSFSRPPRNIIRLVRSIVLTHYEDLPARTASRSAKYPDNQVHRLFKAVAQNDWKTLLTLLNEEHFSEVDCGSRGRGKHVDTLVRNENGFTLLHQAACWNQPEMVDFLWHLSESWECLVDFTIVPSWCPKWPVKTLQQKPMDNGLVEGVIGKNALQLAQILGHHKVVEELRAKANLQSSLLDIHQAVQCGDTQWLASTIAESTSTEALVNNRVEATVTPLWLACTRGDLETVKLLIDMGADVNLRSKNKQGQTLLHRAVCFGNMAVVQYLIEGNYLGVDVKDGYGCTPLYYALQLSLPCMSNLLLRCGANLDSQCVNPLSLTTDSARLLLEHLEFQDLRQLLVQCPQLELEVGDLPVDSGENFSFSRGPPGVIPWPFTLTGLAMLSTSWTQRVFRVSRKRKSRPDIHYYFSLSDF
ncbi:transient receptor potential cation channel subfamily A member 1-like isoform X2 [Hemitrygon akajei]|uniref:transient receptor potential cation channel subfamily A member 1-like isoform X2 n=1 Tax=Hemitrygon akajei TaxID=2704970 RepID=UPI003BF9E716